MRIPTVRVFVSRAESLSPRMRRVTLWGPELAGFASNGLADERVKLLLPQPGQERPVLPEPEVDETGFRYPPGSVRPIARTLTVRRFDQDALELDLDIALHDGPAATWSVKAQPGDEVGVAGPTGGYDLSAADDHLMVLGDEAALPAIATILERLPNQASAHVLVEVGDPSGELDLPRSERAHVGWLHRDRHRVLPGGLLVDAARSWDWSLVPARVWAAGEALAMRAIRRHLRDVLGLPRERYQVVGYWRQRLSEEQAIETHLAAQSAARAAGASEDEVDDAGLY
jgi:NADPH-dependent ferric siderophore reductase